MTDRRPLRRALFERVGSALAKDGFALKAAKDTFLRNTGGATDMFQLVCLDAKPGFRIQPNVGVRIERVETIFHQTSGFEAKYQKDTPTIGSSIGMLTAENNRACEFLMENESELSSAVDGIVDIFERFALPYFETFGTVPAIDKELNFSPATPTPHRGSSWLRCATGAIVARLNGRPDYYELVHAYAEQMRRLSKGFYSGRFEALLQSLETVQPDELPPAWTGGQGTDP